jgi:hypothetical protein
MTCLALAQPAAVTPEYTFCRIYGYPKLDALRSDQGSTTTFC